MASNPVLAHSRVFRGQSYGKSYTRQFYAQPGYGQQGYPVAGYGWQTPTAQAEDHMTVDDVMTKTILSLAIVALAAFGTFVLLPWTLLSGVWLAAGIVTLVIGLMIGRSQTVKAGGVVAYALIEGVFIGAITKLFEAMYPGVAVQAVLATFVAAGVVLASYRYLNVRLSSRAARTITMITMAYAGALLLNFVLSMFGAGLGLTPTGFTMLGMVTALIGATLAVLGLLSDIQQIDQTIRAGAPEAESWRAAFALTVTMVWLYTELLRILGYLRNN